GRELSGQLGCETREIDRLRRRGQPSRIGPREVEQIGGELREARHLLAHRGQELLAGRGVDLWILEQLEKPAEREEGSAKLVGGVGDELTACAVEPREPKAH